MAVASYTFGIQTQIKNVVDPSDATDVATKNYVDQRSGIGADVPWLAGNGAPTVVPTSGLGTRYWRIDTATPYVFAINTAVTPNVNAWLIDTNLEGYVEDEIGTLVGSTAGAGTLIPTTTAEAVQLVQNGNDVFIRFNSNSSNPAAVAQMLNTLGTAASRISPLSSFLNTVTVTAWAFYSSAGFNFIQAYVQNTTVAAVSAIFTPSTLSNQCYYGGPTTGQFSFVPAPKQAIDREISGQLIGGSNINLSTDPITQRVTISATGVIGNGADVPWLSGTDDPSARTPAFVPTSGLGTRYWQIGAQAAWVYSVNTSVTPNVNVWVQDPALTGHVRDNIANLIGESLVPAGNIVSPQFTGNPIITATTGGTGSTITFNVDTTIEPMTSSVQIAARLNALGGNAAFLSRNTSFNTILPLVFVPITAQYWSSNATQVVCYSTFSVADATLFIGNSSANQIAYGGPGTGVFAFRRQPQNAIDKRVANQVLAGAGIAKTVSEVDQSVTLSAISPTNNFSTSLTTGRSTSLVGTSSSSDQTDYHRIQAPSIPSGFLDTGYRTRITNPSLGYFVVGNGDDVTARFPVGTQLRLDSATTGTIYTVTRSYFTNFTLLDVTPAAPNTLQDQIFATLIAGGTAVATQTVYGTGLATTWDSARQVLTLASTSGSDVEINDVPFNTVDFRTSGSTATQLGVAFSAGAQGIVTATVAKADLPLVPTYVARPDLITESSGFVNGAPQNFPGSVQFPGFAGTLFNDTVQTANTAIQGQVTFTAPTTFRVGDSVYIVSTDNQWAFAAGYVTSITTTSTATFYFMSSSTEFVAQANLAANFSTGYPATIYRVSQAAIVTGVSANSGTQLYGQVGLVAGNNVTLSTTGNNITINSTASGGGGGTAGVATGFNIGNTVAANDPTTTNPGTVQIGSGTGFSTNSVVIKPGTGAGGWQFGGQAVGNFVAELGAQKQAFRLGYTGTWSSSDTQATTAFGGTTGIVSDPRFVKTGTSGLANSDWFPGFISSSNVTQSLMPLSSVSATARYSQSGPIAYTAVTPVFQDGQAKKATFTLATPSAVPFQQGQQLTVPIGINGLDLNGSNYAGSEYLVDSTSSTSITVIVPSGANVGALINQGTLDAPLIVWNSGVPPNGTVFSSAGLIEVWTQPNGWYADSIVSDPTGFTLPNTTISSVGWQISIGVQVNLGETTLPGWTNGGTRWPVFLTDGTIALRTGLTFPSTGWGASNPTDTANFAAGYLAWHATEPGAAGIQISVGGAQFTIRCTPTSFNETRTDAEIQALFNINNPFGQSGTPTNAINSISYQDDAGSPSLMYVRARQFPNPNTTFNLTYLLSNPTNNTFRSVEYYHFAASADSFLAPAAQTQTQWNNRYTANLGTGGTIPTLQQVLNSGNTTGTQNLVFNGTTGKLQGPIGGLNVTGGIANQVVTTDGAGNLSFTSQNLQQVLTNGNTTGTQNLVFNGTTGKLQGPIGGLNVTGGTSGQVVQTDGNGNLSFTNQTDNGVNTLTSPQNTIQYTGSRTSIRSDVVLAPNGGLIIATGPNAVFASIMTIDLLFDTSIGIVNLPTTSGSMVFTFGGSPVGLPSNSVTVNFVVTGASPSISVGQLGNAFIGQAVNGNNCTIAAGQGFGSNAWANWSLSTSASGNDTTIIVQNSTGLAWNTPPSNTATFTGTTTDLFATNVFARTNMGTGNIGLAVQTTWAAYTTQGRYNGTTNNVNTAPFVGTVLTYLWQTGMVYRYISTATTSGYPTADAFYSSIDSSTFVPSGLLASRY